MKRCLDFDKLDASQQLNRHRSKGEGRARAETGECSVIRAEERVCLSMSRIALLCVLLCRSLFVHLNPNPCDPSLMAIMIFSLMTSIEVKSPRSSWLKHVCESGSWSTPFAF